MAAAFITYLLLAGMAPARLLLTKPSQHSRCDWCKASCVLPGHPASAVGRHMRGCCCQGLCHLCSNCCLPCPCSRRNLQSARCPLSTSRSWARPRGGAGSSGMRLRGAGGVRSNRRPIVAWLLDLAQQCSLKLQWSLQWLTGCQMLIATWPCLQPATATRRAGNRPQAPANQVGPFRVHRPPSFAAVSRPVMASMRGHHLCHQVV